MTEVCTTVGAYLLSILMSFVRSLSQVLIFQDLVNNGALVSIANKFNDVPLDKSKPFLSRMLKGRDIVPRLCYLSRNYTAVARIRCLFYPCVTTVERKRPCSFCRKCRWQVTPKYAYTLDPTKSEWVSHNDLAFSLRCFVAL